MNIPVAVFAMAATLAASAPAFAQSSPQPSTSTQRPAEPTAPGEGTNAANPGYPIQGGGTYQGPPGKGAVINDDHRYNRT